MSITRIEETYNANITISLINPMDIRAEVKYLRMKIYLRYDSSEEYIWVLEKSFFHPLPLEPKKETPLRLDSELPAHKSEIIEVAIDSGDGVWILLADLAIVTEFIEFTANHQFLVPLDLTLSG